MSKEEFMKIQTCVLKVNIHCDGCKSKVKKILQKIDGVFKTAIDAELGKVTVSGNVDHNLLIKKLQKAGKHAELWGAQKPNSNNNQSQLANQLKNVQLDSGKNGNKGQKGGTNNPSKGGGGGGGQQNQQQQVQQMNGFLDLKVPAFKEMKMPLKDQNQKSVKFNVPEDDDLSDFDDDYDEFDDDEFEDELDDEFDEPLPPVNKKPIMGNGQRGVPDNIMMMMNGNNGGGAQNGKKGGGGGGGSVPVQVNMGNTEGKNGNGGKKGGAGGGNNQNQGGKNGKNGGGFPQNGNNGGGGANNNKNGNNGGGGGGNGYIMSGNGAKKGNNGGGSGGGMGGGMNDGFQNMGGAVPQGMMPNTKMGQMGNMPMGQMGNIPAVQGLPAAAIAGGAGAGGVGGGGGGYFQGAGPEPMPGNPYHQQQYMAAVMNEQRAVGNERFQPMIYARPPPAVNYVPPPPYNPYLNPYPNPYPYPVPHPNQPQDPSYAHFFSDENTSNCNIM